MNKNRILKKVEKKLGLKYKPAKWHIRIKSNWKQEDIDRFREEWQKVMNQQSYMTCYDCGSKGGDKTEITFWDTRTGKQITEKQRKLFADMDKVKQNYLGIAPIEKLPEFNPKQERIQAFKKHWEESMKNRYNASILWSRQDRKDFYNEYFNNPITPFKL